MKRAHYLLVTLIVLAFFGYRPVMTLLQGEKPAGGAVTCDYNGRAYRLEEQRRADDGCNVCSCGEDGWSCTKIACAAGEDAGSITGTLAVLSGFELGQKVCAIDLKDDEQYCQQTTKGETTFVIPAPPGDFWVYATLEDDVTGKLAYYSEFIACGKKEECKDHTPAKVTVGSGLIAHADPQDWDAAGQFDLISVSPSRYEYLTHNYYPTSNFLVRGRGFSKVEIFSTVYPPDPEHREDAPFSLVGQASSTKEERGIQTWSLPVPPGFQAWQVRAKGTSANGEFLMSRELRIVRPIATAAASSTVE